MSPNNLSMEYTVQLWREGAHYIAHSMPLDIMSMGSTPEEARRALDEAVGLFLKTAADMGSLDQILEDATKSAAG